VGLLADDAPAADLLDLTLRIRYEPMPIQEPCGLHAGIMDGYRVGEDIPSRLWIGLLPKVTRQHIHLDLIARLLGGLHIELLFVSTKDAAAQA
jgi:hypothetical protein